MKKVEEVLQLAGQTMKREPRGLASHIVLWDLYRRGPLEAVCVLPDADDSSLQTAQLWLKHLSGHYLPNLVLAVTGPAQPDASDLAIASGKTAVDGRGTFYVCRDFRCSAPMTQWEEIEKHLVP
mgnify:CR=1 FL=1